MPELPFLVRYIGGKTYRGFDPGLDRHIDVAHLEIVSVSEVKRNQLLSDFPGDWEDFGMRNPTAVVTVADNVLPTPLQPPKRRGPNHTKPHEPSQTKRKSSTGTKRPKGGG